MTLRLEKQEGDALRNISEWMGGDVVRDLASRYAESMGKRDVDIGFNLFVLISEIYHRENLHSDMLKAILDTSGNHGQGAKFLELFLEFLRDQHGVQLRVEDFSQARVEREPGRIDLLISDPISMKAIILENKINGAPDMHRQVVRYHHETTHEREYECVAIIYLCLNSRKAPDLIGWSEDEKRVINPLLKVVCAFDESEDDLFSGWLLQCLEGTLDAEVRHVVHQYRQLIHKLGKNLMNKPLMEEFYRLMSKSDDFDSAATLAMMINDLPSYRCQRLMERFHRQHSPFAKARCHSPHVLVFEGISGRMIKIHIDTSARDLTVLQFWDDAEDPAALPRLVLASIEAINLFTLDDGWYRRDFRFPDQEDELYSFLRDFLSRLDECRLENYLSAGSDSHVEDPSPLN